MKRRTVMTALPAGLLLGAAACGERAEEGVAVDTVRAGLLERFGLQLSTLTPLLLKDFEGTLKRVAEIGYRQVEFSALGFLGRPVEYIAELLAELGLSAPVGRISPKLPEGFAALSREEQRAAFRTLSGPEHLLTNVEHALQDAAYLKQTQLNLPALMPENFSTGEKLEASLTLLREAGRLCQQAGVQFGYHNHDWEFKPVDGVVPFDAMLNQVSAELLAIQIDVYWVAKGGQDAVQYFQAHPGRFPSCHLKDMDASGDFQDVGFGVLDFPAIAAAAEAAGTEYFFVERDNPPEPMQSATNSYAYLSQMRF